MSRAVSKSAIRVDSRNHPMSKTLNPTKLALKRRASSNGSGTEAEPAGDLLIRRRVAVLLREAGEEVENLFLSPRDSHAGIVANKKRIAIAILGSQFSHVERG